jgi:hypothetical protein
VTQELADLARDIYESEGKIPPTERTAGSVWSYVESHPQHLTNHISCPGIHQSKSPFETALSNAPGNFVRWSLQRAEFFLVRAMERFHYPAKYVDAIRNQRNQETIPAEWDELETAVAESLQRILEISKSVTQSRRSRAGNSFEWYLAFLLDRYEIPYDRESGTRRVDFRIWPGNSNREAVLSAKTTARERWKQIHDNSYFITLDRGVTESKLEKVKEKGIRIVVPESDKSDVAQYNGEANVFSFSSFLRHFSDFN